MPKSTTTPLRTYYLIDRAALDALPTSAALDMLRYDRAVVEANPPEGFYLLSCEGAVGIERWRSFGIRIIAQDTDQYRLADEGRRRRKAGAAS